MTKDFDDNGRGKQSPSRVSECISSRSVLVGEREALAATHVVHAIPGRVASGARFKSPFAPAEGLRALLLDQTGVIDVTVNRLCGSVTVVYDPAKWTSEALCTFLPKARSREEADAYASVSASSEAETSRRSVKAGSNCGNS